MHHRHKLQYRGLRGLCLEDLHPTSVLYTSPPSKRVVNSSLTRSHVVAVHKFGAVVQTCSLYSTSRCWVVGRRVLDLQPAHAQFCFVWEVLPLLHPPKLQIARLVHSFRICPDSLFYIHPFLFWCNISKRHAIQSAPVKGLYKKGGVSNQVV